MIEIADARQALLDDAFDTDRGELRFSPLSDAATTLAVTAERAFGRRLAASCRAPLAAYAVARGEGLWLRGLVATRDGRQVLRGERCKVVADAQAATRLGVELGDEFLARGAAAILEAL